MSSRQAVVRAQDHVTVFQFNDGETFVHIPESIRVELITDGWTPPAEPEES